MTTELLASKIVVREEPPRIASVPALQTAVLALVGVTERGPVNTATLVQSFEEFFRVFGGFTVNADLTLAARLFFMNGGQFLWVVRIVHYTDITNAGTKQSAIGTLNLATASGPATGGVVTGTQAATFDMEPGDTLNIAVDGNPFQTATFDATADSSTAANTETYALSDGQTIIFAVDGGPSQTVTFNTADFANIAAATAQEVADVINSQTTGCTATVSAGAVVITSNTRGTSSDIGAVTGTAAATFAFAAATGAGGDVADIDAVTFTEVKTVVEADITAGSGVTVTDGGSGKVVITSGTTGVTSTIQVLGSSTADTILGLDNLLHTGSAAGPTDAIQVDGKTDGAYANNITLEVAAPTSGNTNELNLTVLVSGAITEVFANVSVVSTDDNFVETVVNDADTGSQLIAVTLLAALVPDTGTFGPLTGGNDGLAGLADADYIGSDVTDTGLRALDVVQGITLLAVPGQATSGIQNAMITYCETTRDKQIFAILDPPASQTAQQMKTYVDTTASLQNSSEFGAIYWPQIKIVNPSKTVFGDVAEITVAPSGAIAGVMARTDASLTGGIYQPPAGVERGRLLGVVGFETDEVLKETARDLVYPARINPLRSDQGQPPFIDGVRTLKGNGNFPTVSERRGVIFIEQSIKKALEFARLANNTPELRQRVSRTVFSFLLAQMNAGAFRSTNPDTAFFVDFGDGLNPTNVQFAGQLIGRIGLATAKPAEFIILNFSQDTRAFEEELANAGF